jgi:hypothetical protein
MALPFRLALSVHLRRWEGPLVFAAARLSGTPLEDYTMEDFTREYKTEKWCAPTCTIQCVHQVGILDNWRDPQKSEAEVRKEMQKKKESERMVQILRPQ